MLNRIKERIEKKLKNTINTSHVIKKEKEELESEIKHIEKILQESSEYKNSKRGLEKLALVTLGWLLLCVVLSVRFQVISLNPELSDFMFTYLFFGIMPTSVFCIGAVVFIKNMIKYKKLSEDEEEEYKKEIQEKQKSIDELDKRAKIALKQTKDYKDKISFLDVLPQKLNDILVEENKIEMPNLSVDDVIKQDLLEEYEAFLDERIDISKASLYAGSSVDLSNLKIKKLSKK